jgi:hypothetical protein|nr:hypothetical protein [uncultured Capnocytophaga sp.]
MTKAFELFKESLEKISDEDFAKLLDEMENDPQGQGITIGEFFDAIHQKSSIDEIINFDSKNQVKSSVINDFLDKESLVKEVIKINQCKVSYFSNTKQEIEVENKNFLNAA